MKRMILMLCAFCFAGSSVLLGQSDEKYTAKLQRALEQAAPQEILTTWVYFSDKGADLDGQLQEAEANLTGRAYQRRLRNRGADNLVDHRDVPVYAPYYHAVREKVNRIRHKSRWLNALSVELAKADLPAVAQLPFVSKIDLVVQTYSSLPDEALLDNHAGANPAKSNGPQQGHSLNYGSSFAQNAQIGANLMHDLGFNGSGVLVAMLDAGFNNLQHEAMDHLNILATWDFVNGDSIVSDEVGQMGNGNHGTLTLSTLAGFHEGQLIGPGYGADFVLAKTENTDWEHNVEEDAWVAGAEWADSLGADIISSSLAYRDFDPGQISYTWQDMDGNTAVSTIGADIAASRGILVVNSAANEGPGATSIWAPADGDSVLAIGAVNESGGIASFSSRGPSADGRIKPDVCARGVGTVCSSPYDPGGYTSASGTSLSCPLVAGAAAQLLQANPNLTNMEIAELLRNTADRAANPDNDYGWGIINVHAAYLASLTGIPGGDGQVAAEFQLYPAYPNPFNPTTTIRYTLPEAAALQLSVYNPLGQKVATLADGVQPAGEYRVSWDAAGLASGVYYITLTSGRAKAVRKAVLLK